MNILPHKLLPAIILLGIVHLLNGCTAAEPAGFTDVTGSSGIEFVNSFQETEKFNVFNFMNMYNGGGVAVGDLNNDGLPDLFFTANQLPDRLYLNKGDLSFEDITEKAGVAGKPGWKTGVSMADVNGDGLLDIYVCYSGLGDAAYRANQLFINQGVENGYPVFHESAAAFGLDAPGTNSNQAVFFDFDRDGDLDMFLLNHATTFYSPFVNTSKLRSLRHPSFSHRLYRNDGGHFTDISIAAGLKGGGNTFGLGVIASDVNKDGWPDLYMTNDFEEQDYLLLNKHDGTFEDVTKKCFGHISRYGMGCDIADYNNDAEPDIFVADMLPEDNRRQKLLKGPDQYDKYTLLVDSGYFHQNMRNTFQVCQGIDEQGLPRYAEIGQLAGISNTDWSWAPLFADFDNDGLKDLFLTNGYWRDFTNLDFSNYVVNDYQQQHGNQSVSLEVMEHLSQTKLSNYIFRNKGDLTFENVSAEQGMTAKTSANGAAYADLDNDGDLDLIINNIGEKAQLYRNNAKTDSAHYLRIQLQDTGMNRNAIGATLLLETGSGGRQYAELFPVRGFLSTVEPVIHFGLGKDTSGIRLTVNWPDGRRSVYKRLPVDKKILLLARENNETPLAASPGEKKLFTDITATCDFPFRPRENLFVDFKHYYFVPWQLSRQGPRLATQDVNGDGLDDVFVGAPSGQAAMLCLQTADGRFIPAPSQPWQPDSLCEDVQPVFFDADGDGDPDLYVVSGGSEWKEGAEALRDRLYINNGKGVFSKVEGALPVMTTSKACVAVADFNRDGKPDLFVGGRLKPGAYGSSPDSYLLLNNSRKGKIGFTDVTNSAAAALRLCGMVTDACWTDVNVDSWPDLVLAGEWMPVRIFLNQKGRLVESSEALLTGKTGGLWTRVLPGDFDQDGRTDFLLGNLAPNTQFHAAAGQPMTLCINDYLKNGQQLPILNYFIQGTAYPYLSRDELTEPLPSLKKKFLKYAAYADATMHDIFSEEQMRGMKELAVQTLSNSWLRQQPDGKYVLLPLPVPAQFSAIQSFLQDDFDGDGKTEILAAGNFYPFRVQLGREDAGKGLLLIPGASGNFQTAGYSRLGVWLDGDVRDMVALKTAGRQKIIIISRNDDNIQIIKANP
ncbi:VCBS repeat-containing protein [Flavihumibacter petaseus]|nr:VCBS repeat-containing protein [Flavihumibacter petaseus]